MIGPRQHFSGAFVCWYQYKKCSFEVLPTEVLVPKSTTNSNSTPGSKIARSLRCGRRVLGAELAFVGGLDERHDVGGKVELAGLGASGDGVVVGVGRGEETNAGPAGVGEESLGGVEGALGGDGGVEGEGCELGVEGPDHEHLAGARGDVQRGDLVLGEVGPAVDE